MADIAIFRINYKSDFILTLQSDAGWLTPFCIKFWTGAPSQAYFVGYDGTTYTHCAPVDDDPTRLTVQFDNHNLPIGNLKFQIAYHFTVADFPNDTEDEVINPADIIIEIDGTPHQVMLDFQGETAPEIEFSLPAYANEAQRIANEEERERVFAEMQAENAEAVEGAERVNATLSGNTLTVTDRNGNSTSVNTKGEPGIGIPDGGTTNQVLVKESDNDYDVMWRNAPASGVNSVNGKYGEVVLNAGDVGAQPVIPDLGEIRSGAAAGATAYQKPSTGIPQSDLASGVQSSLNKADTALQQPDITPIENDIDAIEAKIPSAASASNQLADKNFVNSSIATNTATFKGTYNSLAELQAVTGATNNDYGFVIEYDQQGNEYYDRYKFNGTAWVFEYKIESTPFTAAQWAAVQSGITSGDVQKLAALPTKAQLDALLDAKQDVINDLATIRSGASAGATAYQKPSTGIPQSDLASGVQSSLNKADTALQQPDITPIENDIDAIEAKIPSAASASNQLADKNFVNSSIATNTATFKGTYNSLAELQAVTGATNNDYGFVIEYDQQGNEYYDRYKFNGTAWVFEYKIESTPFTAAQWAAIQSGITSGDVQKLAALPTKAQLDALLDAKQDVINDLATIRSGASAGATAYQKPSGGIPKSDLATAVQTSLNKADSALQSYTESDPVFTASPAHGITSADITAWNGKADKVAIVNHGTSDTTFTLTPNIFHVWGTVASLTLTLATASTTTMDEFMFQFTSGTTATTLSLPSTVKWVAEPEIEADMTYQVSIVNNIAVIGGVA